MTVEHFSRGRSVEENDTLFSFKALVKLVSRSCSLMNPSLGTLEGQFLAVRLAATKSSVSNCCVAGTSRKAADELSAASAIQLKVFHLSYLINSLPK